MKFIVFVILISCSGTKPTNIGVENGTLAECPESPNCVGTMSSQPEKKMEAIPFAVSTKQIHQILTDLIKAYERTQITKTDSNYIHAEFSTFAGWTDDVEFYIDPKAHLIHFRSASRIGRSDFGTNRDRMEEITALLKAKLNK